MAIGAAAAVFNDGGIGADATILLENLQAAQLRQLTLAGTVLLLAVLLAELRSSTARLHGAINALREGLTIVDGSGRLVLVNQRIADIYPDLADVMVPGRRLEDVLHIGAERGVFDLEGSSAGGVGGAANGPPPGLEHRCRTFSERRALPARLGAAGRQRRYGHHPHRYHPPEAAGARAARGRAARARPSSSCATASKA